MTPLATAAGGDIIHSGPRIDTEATVAPALCVLARPGLLPAPPPAAVCPLSRMLVGPESPAGVSPEQEDREASVLP